jgi:hypothetical protein
MGRVSGARRRSAQIGHVKPRRAPGRSVRPYRVLSGSFRLDVRRARESSRNSNGFVSRGGLAGGQSLQTTIGFVWSRGLAGGQSLQTTIGFVWSRGLAGGQSLQTPIGFVWSRGSWGANRYRPPLGSSENRGRHNCNHAGSAPPGPRPFSWGGVTIPMVMTVRLVSGLPGGQSLQTTIGFVWSRGLAGGQSL